MSSILWLVFIDVSSSSFNPLMFDVSNLPIDLIFGYSFKSKCLLKCVEMKQMLVLNFL